LYTHKVVVVATRLIAQQVTPQHGIMAKSEKQLNLVAYCWVSTEKHRSIERYAAPHGYRIVEWLDEKALSGASRDRPKFQKLLTMIPSPNIDGVVIYDVTRLVRDEDLGEDRQ